MPHTKGRPWWGGPFARVADTHPRGADGRRRPSSAATVARCASVSGGHWSTLAVTWAINAWSRRMDRSAASSGSSVSRGAAIAARRSRMIGFTSDGSVSCWSWWGGAGGSGRVIRAVVRVRDGWVASGNVPLALGWPRGWSVGVESLSGVVGWWSVPLSPGGRRRGSGVVWLVAIVLHGRFRWFPVRCGHRFRLS